MSSPLSSPANGVLRVNFSDIGGQGPGAYADEWIQSNRIHHAYLLTGSRGSATPRSPDLRAASGARTRNGTGSTWSRRMPSCQDAAGFRRRYRNRSRFDDGVESVREIRESVKFMPSSGSWKTTSSMEVHMLTTSAFNALRNSSKSRRPDVLRFRATNRTPQTSRNDPLARPALLRLERFTWPRSRSGFEEVAAREIADEPGALALLSRAADGLDAGCLADQVIVPPGKKSPGLKPAQYWPDREPNPARHPAWISARRKAATSRRRGLPRGPRTEAPGKNSFNTSTPRSSLRSASSRRARARRGRGRRTGEDRRLRDRKRSSFFFKPSKTGSNDQFASTEARPRSPHREMRFLEALVAIRVQAAGRGWCLRSSAGEKLACAAVFAWSLREAGGRRLRPGQSSPAPKAKSAESVLLSLGLRRSR